MSTARILVTSLILSLSTACLSSEEKLQQSYVNTWETRLGAYEQEVNAKRSVAEKAAAYMDATYVQSTKDSESTSFETDLATATASVREAAIAEGRVQIMRTFMQQFSDATTPGLLDVWFQQQAQDLMHRSEMQSQQVQNLYNSQREYGLIAEELVLLEDVTVEGGLIEGASKELEALYQQAVTYYNDVGRERQIAAEKQRNFQAALTSLQNYNQQQQMLNALQNPRSYNMNCNTFGTTTNCSGWQ